MQLLSDIWIFIGFSVEDSLGFKPVVIILKGISSKIGLLAILVVFKDAVSTCDRAKGFTENNGPLIQDLK